LIQVNAARAGCHYSFLQQEDPVITHDGISDKWARVAAECRRLAELTIDEWMRAELL
jgi:hypothetical protein